MEHKISAHKHKYMHTYTHTHTHTSTHTRTHTYGNIINLSKHSVTKGQYDLLNKNLNFYHTPGH